MEKYSEKEVQELVQSLRKGDANAFDALFAIYGSRLFGFVNGYLKIKEEAEEVVQEVFLTVWRTKENLKPELSFKAYLFKIAYHRVLEHFEYISRQQEYIHHIVEESVEFTNDLDERLNYQMLLEKVELCIAQLPSRQREILIKKRKEGYSVKEIAKQLAISPKTVENHLSEALKKLKKELGVANVSAILMFVFGKSL
ncbi:RNA polymerase sigma-70 factor [Maribellus sp. YY47]|uniref:RNA polymerase sigma factor n=1 Tax=Maribellus sp. YY47 TaxID=2929486 RepID=UPI0020009E53|nr:RNA polymerase sigma-70 factor [Maribellus sp. YY47]MCK3685518.1 RNA polymerase sigma-70 factor [Maribellus sp. YY47]